MVNTGLILAFLFSGYGLESLAIAWALGLLVEQCLIWLQARPFVPLPPSKRLLPQAEQREIRGFAAKMTLWSMASFMRHHADHLPGGSGLLEEASVDIHAVAAGDEGDYTVVVTNASGSTTSDPVSLG